MSTLKILVNKRKFLRKCVTEIHNVTGTFSTLSYADKQTKTSVLENYQKELKELDEKILEIKCDEWDEEDVDSKIEQELVTSASYESKIANCLTYLNLRTSSTPSSSEDKARSLLKSPTAPLPKYQSKEDEDLIRFFEQFEETINQYNYVDYDKFTLLKQQLSGRALILVNSLDADNRSYANAKKILTDALASNDTQIFSVIRRLSEMRLAVNTDPFEYFSKMKLISDRVTKLNITSDSFLRYFFWVGLNEDFQKQLIQITNHTKPTLKEIWDNFFSASERYISLQKHVKGKRSINGSNLQDGEVCLAANVNYPAKMANFKPCSICSKLENNAASHPIYKCDKFPEAHDKVNKLKAFNACVKCSGINHQSEGCKYKFNQRCKHCSGWHFSFLCLRIVEGKEKANKSTKGNKDSDKKKKEETSSNLCLTEALKSDLNGNSILPTFSVCVNDRWTIRGLKDGGCQSNLVTTQLADKLGLKVLQSNVPLTVNGINAPQNYQSKLVELSLEIGGQHYVVTAFCLPEIKISLDLPNLGKIVTEFTRKGYKLADSQLVECRDCISDIEFILGTKYGYCLPESEKLLGQNSIISETPAGVLLKGDTVSLLKNLPKLPWKTVPPFVTHCSLANNLVEVESSNFFSKDDSENRCDVSVNFVVNESGLIRESEIQKALDDVLEKQCSYYTNLDNFNNEENSTEVNDRLVTFALDNMSRDKEGRLCVPLFWNSKVCHLLGKNRNLAEAILKCNLKKLQKNHSHFELMDKVFHEQEEAGIIERIENLDEFLKEHPEHSFLAHMGVFKLNRETTKCRVVYLSNLCEKDPTQTLTVSHNQAILPGPSLNQKLASSLLHLRFGSHLLCFDLCKAFNMLALNEVDSNRLLCLWFRNVAKGDFSLIGYRNVRLSFGLRCSPTLLLLALYRILVLDTNEDSECLRSLKKLIYALSYMDNCAVTADNKDDLLWAYKQLRGIFEPYKFSLQQFITNCDELQNQIDIVEEKETPLNVKLLGINWERNSDNLSTLPIKLDINANSKRSILSSIASQFDIYNFNGPLLNRARFFLHKLQMDKDLGWDEVLDDTNLREWHRIAKQLNNSPPITIKRFVGSRTNSYRLVGCSDSSKQAYGGVIYIQNLENNEISFVMAKNRLISKELASKSIPSLELKGISFITKCLIDLYNELSGPSCIMPIEIKDIVVLSDSFVALSWINSYTHKLEKMQKRNTFVLNRLNDIEKLCEIFPVTFSFVSGVENPGDCMTRCLSYRQLCKTNYLTGPEQVIGPHSDEHTGQTFSITVPNPQAIARSNENILHSLNSYVQPSFQVSDHLDLLVRCSDFNKVVRTYRSMLVVVDRFKKNLKRKKPDKYSHMSVKSNNHNFYEEACTLAIRKDQESQYPDIINFLKDPKCLNKDMPNIIGQLNVYLDSRGLLRVRSKLSKLQQARRYNFPILLSKGSPLTRLIILEYHIRFSHAGCYTMLSELRKQFWIPQYFSTVKKTLKSCIICRRFNERTINLNQNDYREFRADPPTVPFRTVFMDYLGPFFVKIHGSKTKVWLLCITCTWSRAINLKICMDLTVAEFLRAFQIHCYEYGIPEHCVTDLGSQLVAASNVIRDYLKDADAKAYFDESGIRPIKFDQFYKGCSELGSMVEICVKLTKKLLFGAIKNNILSYRDFEFLICKTVHLLNRRPIAFKEALRDSDTNVPDPITPELLIHGYALPSINLIPQLQGDPDDLDPEWVLDTHPSDKIKNSYRKLQKVRSNLITLYHEEFLNTLVSQAINVKDRYKPVNHKALQIGDIVLLKELHAKPSQYPMGIVKEVSKNSLNEITGAIVLKGKSREIVKRHVSSLIPLLSTTENLNLTHDLQCPKEDAASVNTSKRRKRKAAIAARAKFKSS